ncbi:MAG: HAD family phosphatase [Chloroflexota bacterium]|jgi:epoxide hydrolase-like predicted phosphatase
MIKAVIFDVGGVLIRTPDRSSREAWERKLGLSEWESEEIVFNGEMGKKAQLGQISNDELWNWVGQRLALSESQLYKFRRDFWAGDRLDAELVTYIRSLRKYYQTAIISNATDALRGELDVIHSITDAFDLIVVSAEEKIMKPNPLIYQRTLERLGRSAQEAVFVDDSQENVMAAQDLGLVAVHFTSDMDVPSELAAVGVTVP